MRMGWHKDSLYSGVLAAVCALVSLAMGSSNAVAQEGTFQFPANVKLEVLTETPSPCFDYAIAELSRLLKGVGITAETREPSARPGWHVQILGADTSALPFPDVGEVRDDGYVIDVTEDGMVLSAREPKGVLNGVYDLAERMGYLFLYPGEEGEWAPNAEIATLKLPVGATTTNSRFPHRGIFNGNGDEEWLAYYTKLRLNAFCNPADQALAEKFGLRIEQGGHELDELLPYDEIDEHPDMYRMDQPDDFFGKRVNDYNLCIASPRAKRIIQENYRARIHELAEQGIYAWHTWHEDLAAGAWCMCPTCRSLVYGDQAMVAMGFLADVVREEQLPMRVPMLAYHDTMFPGPKIDASAETFLLFAPRERCYGHALDDPTCPKNALYFRALKEWTAKFAGTDDAHTFEYYLDRVLFRGLYPFIPGVILDDMRVYEEHGIETHLALQVGTAFVPRLTMLNLPIFAHAAWDSALTTEQFIAETAARISPADPKPWQDYFAGRAAIFAEVMRWEHAPDSWSDYRWIPESTRPYGEEMARIYEKGTADLDALADALEKAIVADWPNRTTALAKSEVGRTRFEATEVAAMAAQQGAANRLGAYLNHGSRDDLAAGIERMHETLSRFNVAVEEARKAGVKEGDYYYMFNTWIQKELNQKIVHWEEALAEP